MNNYIVINNEYYHPVEQEWLDRIKNLVKDIYIEDLQSPLDPKDE